MKKLYSLPTYKLILFTEQDVLDGSDVVDVNEFFFTKDDNSDVFI